MNSRLLPMLALTVLSFALPRSGVGATIVETGTGGPIPPTGTTGCNFFDIVISESGTISDITIRLFGLNHTRVGDLQITLTNEAGGISRDLIFRAGAAGGVGGGDNSNLSGDYAFNDAYGASFWAAAANANGTNSIVPGGNYFASTVDGTVVSLRDSFGGLDASGTWRLSIRDLVSNDVGSLAQWQLELSTDEGLAAVPEPATYLLLALGLGSLALCRRRK